MERTNLRKFQTANPVATALIDRFYRGVATVAAADRARSLLDAGCGEGEGLARLGDRLPDRTVAVDADPDAVALTGRRLPAIETACHSIDSLPFEDDSFDLVLCLEVLEHVREPGAALGELARVCGDRVVLSVPDEPWFRLGSLARGKYLRGLGDHPEHLNHWNRGSLRALLEREVDVISLRRSFPWVIAECRPRRRPPAVARTR
jgi:SAM-dependent methyltransferase